MYDSNVTVKDFIDALVDEADVSIPIPEADWLRWLNAVEQFAYTEILNEYVSTYLRLDNFPSDVIPVSMLDVPEGAAAPIVDDIIRIYADGGEQIPKSGVIGALEFPDKNTFYVDFRGNIVLRFREREEPDHVTVVYRLRPALKTADNKATLHVALPPEYLDMAAAKMRGEAYKIANEDGIAGKWLADYNQQVQNFQVWAASRNERFGA